MSEKPIERLNYFNGQRLEADDLRIEQEYHVRIQRWLMKSLFTPGVADGYDVRPIDDGKKVEVMPGLALDKPGRAIILVNSIKLQPQGRYLCVRYAEQKEGVQGSECKVKVNGAGNEQLARWKGPGRIVSEPDFFWRRDPPLADERELIIAELILNADCTVDKVEYGARKQAVAAPLAHVRPVSLEGEKDIDSRNPKVIRFHVAHARATKVTLHLRATAFSTLHYTEMPSHNHSAVVDPVAGTDVGPEITSYSLKTEAASGIDAHTHGVGTMKTGGPGGKPDGAHDKHKVVAQATLDSTIAPDGNVTQAQKPNTNELGLVIQHQAGNYIFTRVLTDPRTLGKSPFLDPNADANMGGVNMVISEGAHFHSLSGETGSATGTGPGTHTHVIPRFTVSHSLVGATGIPPRSDVSHLTFFRRLAVKIRHGSGNVVNCTDKILEQLKQTNPSVWSPPGISITSLDGGHGQPLTESGTGPIRLDLVDGLTFEPDEFVPYEIELAVEGDGNGGCIQYNLYVE